MDGSTLSNSRRSGASAASTRVVDVIIPVYSGLAEVRACLESLLSSRSELQGQVIVINDCSPEPAIDEFLRRLEGDSGITLLENDENLGFVKSCNRAAALRPDNDFILLNADTEVHGNWLDRMVAHAATASDIASITPFSNNATIASYPRGGAARETPLDIRVAQIDEAMSSANAGESVPLPTAVGFCMWVSRAAWHEVGGFDERFGRGYGEEVEFCMATAANGWRHLLACDVFVYHAGGTSFGYESDQLKVEAQQIIDDRYPQFPELVQDWIREDPALDARVRCDVQLLGLTDAPRILHVTHNMGGGVEQHVRDLATASAAKDNSLHLVLRPWGEDGYRLERIGGEGEFRKLINAEVAPGLIARFLATVRIQRVHFHHYAGVADWVLALPDELALPYDVTVHDFVSVCPQFHFQEPSGRYCGRPSAEDCNRCIAGRPNHLGLDISAWRSLFSSHFTKAERVICPTRYVARVIGEYFPGVSPEVLAHPEPRSGMPSGYAEQTRSRLKVAIVGGLSPIKGVDLVEAVIRLAESSELPVDFVVIGFTTRPLYNGCRAGVTGPYSRAELPHILVRERPDCFLFLPQIPETFSYTLSACLATGLPIVARSLGAFEERLENIARAHLLPADATAQATLDLIMAQQPAYDTVISTATETHTGDTPEDAYLLHYLAPLSPAIEADLEGLAGTLSEMDKADAPRGIPAPPIDELLDAALGQRTEEHQAELRRQVRHSAHIVAQQTAHLRAKDEEVAHLESVIHEVREASEREENHLKSEIAALQASKERDVQHLQGQVTGLTADRDSLQTALGQSIDEARQSAAEAEHFRAEAEMWLARVRELEGSTLWRMMAPVRWVLHPIKPLLRPMLRLARFLRKVLLFCRYHFAMGGWRGLGIAAGRRLKRLQHRQVLERPARDTQASIAPDLQQPPLALQTCTDPALTIVIPCYGQHEVTAQCLQSIASFPPSVPYEVLVADDAFATPFDPAQFCLTGVTVLRAEQNQGFLRNCNAAVSVSAGDRVLLLNNDTMVLEGAVDALWQTFERFEGVGAVGAKLLYPNGRLQEAGGIIWRDGSGWNWGRDENADAPRFNYVRDADYCSAAALMVDKVLWDTVGGFDPRFAPCYYEDTDLCFAIRRQGKRVLYQPAAEVLHFEGVSHGTDISEGAKANQARHQVTFAQKWRRELALHAANGELPHREADRGARARILWLEACVITPDQDSGSLRTLRLLRLLLKLGCKVTFAADNLLADEPYCQQLRDEGIEVLHAPHVQSMGEYLRDHGGLYDVVTLCRHYIAIQHVDLLREHHPDTQIWFDTIDLHYLRLRRQHELDQAPATLKMAELAYDEECEVISKSDLTIVVSEFEVAELANEAPAAKVAVISNIHEVARDRPAFDDRSGVMFVGGFQHPPNIDAVEYYANEIWPLLTERCPDLETYVIGSRMPDRLKKLGESTGLKMVGFVEDLTPYYESCMLAIAPLRYGAGVKGKVNQALSFGLPVVGSPVAFEGMGLTHEREVMVAETAEDFAASVAKVCADPALWQTLSERGGASLAGRFTPEVAEAALRDVLGPWLD